MNIFQNIVTAAIVCHPFLPFRCLYPTTLCCPINIPPGIFITCYSLSLMKFSHILPSLKSFFFNFLLCYLETNELKVLTKLSNRALPQVEYLCQLFYCTIIPILLYQIHDFPNEGRRIIEYKLWILS